MDEFYTINQVATVLKVHPLTIRRYVKTGKLKAYRVGGNIRISVNDLKQFTEGFTPQQQKTKNQSFQTKEFSFSDPILALKGKGLGIGRIDQNIS